jgi:2-polyprenyl-3-methyl-5-hydroxy-6-metoxy-1,4-benzoquinol methylase
MDVVGVAAETAGNTGYRSQSRSEILQFLPPGRQGMKVLEIGCGDGSFSASVPGASERWGVEPFAIAAEGARARLDRVFATTFEAAKPELPPRFFDLVICNDVIEHMTDHDAFLRSAQDVMADGSVIVGSLPNVRYYRNLFDLVVASDWEYQDQGILDRTHFRFFTKRSIRRSLEHAGFRVERLEGINGGIQLGLDKWTLARSVFAYGMIAATAGRAGDIRHLQFAFRAARPPAGAA